MTMGAADLHPNALDLTGQTFGRLEALEPTDERSGSYVVWLCRCGCGDTTKVSSGNLRSGDSRSCGCLRREQASERESLNLRGQNFGRLTALEPTDERCRGCVVWRCRCDCGEIARVSTANLRRGHTQSCGCLRRDRARERRLDLRGHTFGRLEAVEPTNERSGSFVVWRCRCECGGTTKVATGDLRKGHNLSCGCLHQQKTAERRLDLRGDTFGRLTAVEPTEERRDGRVMWLCRCECGETTKVRSSVLVSGGSKSCGCRQAAVGRDNPNWSGGATPEVKRVRSSAEYAEWKRAVYVRDGHRCRVCSRDLSGGAENPYERPCAHHLLPFLLHPRFRFAQSNGVTLCRGCHTRFHAEYGMDCDPADFTAFRAEHGVHDPPDVPPPVPLQSEAHDPAKGHPDGNVVPERVRAGE